MQTNKIPQKTSNLLKQFDLQNSYNQALSYEMKWAQKPKSPIQYNTANWLQKCFKNSRTDTYIFMEQGWVGRRRKNQAMCEELIRKWSWIWFFTQPKRFEHWLGSLSPCLSLSLSHGFDFTPVGLHHCAHTHFGSKKLSKTPTTIVYDKNKK